MSLRETKRRDTERRILTAARRLFLARGYADTSMAELAAVAGVSRATLFNYYPGKAALLRSLAAGLDARFARTVAHYRDREPDAYQALKALFARAAMVLEQTGGFTRVLVLEGGECGGFPALLAAFEGLARTGQTSGRWRDDLSAAQLAETLYLFFLAGMLDWCPPAGGRSTPPFSERARELDRLLARPV